MTLPDLEKRFLPPEGWQEGFFENPETGHKIRYGFVTHPAPKACAVVLGGLSEFAEKYFETMHDLLSRGFSVYTMDWAFQGLSNRANKNTQKRESNGYESDISDLHFLIENHIPKNTNLPLILLAHSMGGHIGLRYLQMHTNIFKAAAFSAPMMGIKGLPISTAFTRTLIRLLIPFHKSYVPGGKDWHESMRSGNGDEIFSSDPARDSIHKKWCLFNPALRVGSPTLGWLWESLKSIHTSMLPEEHEKVKIPVLFAAAGSDAIVDNEAIRKTAQALPNSTYLEIKGAQHEILMEKDEYRMQFFKAFDELVKQAKITP